MGELLNKLPLKRRIFVVEYCADFDKIRAAKEAGYKEKNVSTVASSLLSDDKVQAAIAEYMQPRMDAAGLTIDAIQQQLKRFLFFDPIQLCDEHGYLRCKLSEVPEDARQCIKSWEVTPIYHRGDLIDERVKVVWVDKERCLELTMRYLGMFKDIHITNTQVNFWTEVLDKQQEEPITVEAQIKEIVDGKAQKNKKRTG